MVPKLAYRNLFHDRLSLVVTLVGIVFSVVLVAVQFGLYLGSEDRIAAMLDQAKGDLWVVPLGTKSFDDPSLLPGREKHADPVHAGRRQRRGAGRRLRQLAQARGRHRRRRCWSAPTPRPQAPCPGTSSRAASAISPRPTPWRSTRPISRSSASSKLGDRAEINNMQVTVSGRHPRHPLLHDAALRLHHARHGAHAAGRVARPVVLRARAASRRAATSRSVRKALAGAACRMPRSSPTPSSASAASTTGCSRPARARR